MSQTVPLYYSKAKLNQHYQKQKLSLEDRYRIQFKHCHQIQIICRNMCFPYYTIATAQHLFHSFFAQHAFEDFPIDDVVIACVFLASKLEETIKKLKELILVAYNILDKDIGVEAKDIEDQKKHLINIEQRLLEACGFHFHYTQPHPFLIKMAKKLKISSSACQIAWNIVENSFKSNISLQFPSHLIAFSCLCIAQAINHQSIQFTLNDLRPLRIKVPQIEDVCKQLMEMYQQSSLEEAEKQPVIDAISKVIYNLKRLSSPPPGSRDLGRDTKEKEVQERTNQNTSRRPLKPEVDTMNGRKDSRKESREDRRALLDYRKDDRKEDGRNDRRELKDDRRNSADTRRIQGEERKDFRDERKDLRDERKESREHHQVNRRESNQEFQGHRREPNQEYPGHRREPRDDRREFKREPNQDYQGNRREPRDDRREPRDDRREPRDDRRELKRDSRESKDYSVHDHRDEPRRDHRDFRDTHREAYRPEIRDRRDSRGPREDHRDFDKRRPREEPRDNQFQNKRKSDYDDQSYKRGRH